MIAKKGKANKYFYTGLVIIQTLLLVFAFFKEKNKQHGLLTFLSIVGLAFHFEYPLYISKAYKYKLKILEIKEQDNSLGSVLSQGLFVPAAAIFISIFNLGWKIKILFTMYFVLIEKFFLKIKIYKNRWWRTTCTGLFIFASFFVSDVWYKALKNGNKVFLKITLYQVIHVIYMVLLFIGSLYKKFIFKPRLFTRKPWYYHYSFVKLYLVFETTITTWLLVAKNKWLKTLPFFIITMMDSILIKLKVLKVKKSYWLDLFPIRLSMHFLSLIIQKWINSYELKFHKK